MIRNTLQVTWFCVSLLAFLPRLSLGMEEACLPANIITTATGIYRTDTQTLTNSSLITKTLAGYFVTQARASLQISEQGIGEVLLEFPSDTLGIPYQVFGIEVSLQNIVIAALDFTNHCEGPGISLLPQDKFHIPVFKLSQEWREKCRENCKVDLRVWGFL